MKCDVLIIGAGLSGATCGFLLAQAGCSVLAVDRADLLTKDKLCGGMLTVRSLDAMEQIFGSVPSDLFQETFETMLAIDTRVKKGSNTARLGVHMSIARRRDLDNYVVGRFLDAGGMLADRSKVECIDPVRRCARVETPAGRIDVSYRYLVVADGANSSTRKLLSQVDPALSPKPKVALVPSIEAIVEPTGAEPTGWYVPAIGGYCWYFPCGDQANIGADGAKATAAQLKEALTEFAGMMGIDEMRDLRGAFIPSGGSYLLQSRDAFFVGDAAGLVCPATSEGIYYALQSAKVLASCLVCGSDYKKAMAPYLRTLRLQYVLSKPLLNDRFTGMGVRAAEALHIDVAEIPRVALRVAGSFSSRR